MQNCANIVDCFHKNLKYKNQTKTLRLEIQVFEDVGFFFVRYQTYITMTANKLNDTIEYKKKIVNIPEEAKKSVTVRYYKTKHQMKYWVTICCFKRYKEKKTINIFNNLDIFLCIISNSLLRPSRH